MGEYEHARYQRVLGIQICLSENKHLSMNTNMFKWKQTFIHSVLIHQVKITPHTKSLPIVVLIW